MTDRSAFPIFQRKTFINSCSYGALGEPVRQAYFKYLADRDEYGSHWEHWCGMYESLRDLVAEFLGAERDEIALTASASAGINALASALDFSGPRNRVITDDFSFPTAAQIWHAQKKRGARIEHLAERGKSVPLEAFERAIDERTLLVSVSHVCYRNGAKSNVPAILEIARERGALVMLDSYQALGQLPVDAHALGVDFLVGGCLKYLLSSAGMGLLYVRRDLTEQLLPTTSGWFAQADVHAMDISDNHPAPNARRFEMGTPPVPAVYTTLAGIGLIHDYGIERIAREVSVLTAALKEGALERGFKLATPEDPARHGAMIAIRSNDEHALVAALADEGVVTSCRDGNLRVSAHFYNNLDDIERVLAALDKHRRLVA